MKKRSLFLDSTFIYFIVIVGFVAIRIITSLVKVSGPVSVILSVLIQVGFMFAVPLFLYKILKNKTSAQTFNDFFVKKINTKTVIYSICLGFVIYFLTLSVASFFNIFITATGYDPSFGMATVQQNSYPLINFLGDLVITALLPGICEEFCHRGMLLNGCKQLGAKKSIILVGLLFGLMHLNIEQFFYASAVGMFLTFLVYISGSIIPSIIVHILNNAIGLYFAFAKYNNLPFGNFDKNMTSVLSGDFITVIGTILLIVFILLSLLAFFTFKILKNTRVNQIQTLTKKAIDQKQREDLLKSFDLNVDQVNAEQGICQNLDEPEVVIGGEIIKNGRRSLIVDFNFKNDSLMGTPIKKPSLKDKAFLFAVSFIGIFITISTLIWGIL